MDPLCRHGAKEWGKSKQNKEQEMRTKSQRPRAWKSISTAKGGRVSFSHLQGPDSRASLHGGLPPYGGRWLGAGFQQRGPKAREVGTEGIALPFPNN